jgi:sugar lactone lactonase YvrE
MKRQIAHNYTKGLAAGTVQRRSSVCPSRVTSGMRNLLCVGFAIVLLIGLGAVTPASAQATAVFSYAQSVVGGTLSGPGGVAVDRSGNLYIADAGGNVVLKVPPTDRTCSTPGDCTQIAGNAGLNGPYDVAVDVSGNIYIADYVNSRVLKVPPTDQSCSTLTDCPAIGTGYTLKFNGPIGLTVDGSGNLYVVEHLNDFILKIPPSDQNCTTPSDCTQIGSGVGFDLPNGVALDAAGNIYISSQATPLQNLDFVEKVPATDLTCSTPSDCTTIASSLTTSTGEGLRTPWGISVDNNGNIYIVDSGNVRTIRVPPTDPQCTSLCTTVGNGFSFPSGTRAALGGNVYIADTSNARVLRDQTQGVSFDTVPVGTTSSVLSLTYTFTNEGTLGGVSVLTQGATGLDFADAGTGSCTTNGNVHAYGIGDTCTLNVQVTPALTGLRQGAAQLKDTSGKIIATAFLYVAGSGPQVGFSPAVQSQVASHLTLSSPVALAMDSSSNIYIGDSSNNRVLKVPPTDPTCSTPADCILIGGHLTFNGVTGVAIDGSGNVYIVDSRNNRVVKVPPTDPTCAVTADCPTVGSSLTNPFGVALDGGGNVYITNGNNTVQQVLPVDPTCLIPGYCTTWGSGFNFPAGIAVDVNGNVYVADVLGNRVLRVPPFDPSCSTDGDCITVGGSSVNTPRGVGVDGNSNLYIAGGESVLKVPVTDLTCSTPGDCTMLGSGLYGPSGVEVDSLGNVYIADSGNNRILKEDFSDAPILNFATTAVGSVSSDSPQTVTVENIGNAPLIFPPPASGQNPSVSANFNIGATVTCPVLTPASSDETLAVGASCALPIDFAPIDVGSISGSVVLTDNALNLTSPSYATQTISVSGTSTQASQTIDFTPLVSPENYGIPPITLTATASSGLRVTFSVLSGPGTISGNILAVTAAGTIVVAANQAGDTDYAPAAQVTQSLVVNKAPTSVNGTVPTLTYGQSGSSTVTVTGVPGGTVPSGTVSYSMDSGPTQNLTLSGGQANLPIPNTLPAGLHGILLTYNGDKNYQISAGMVNFTVGKASQTITFPAPPSPVPFGVAPITLSATASSNLPVAFSVVSGPGSLSGSTLTVTGAGTIVVAANQAGNANYNAAPQVTQSIVVNQASQTITFPAPPSPVTYGVAPITLSATASSNLPVTFSVLSGPGSLNGSTLTVTGVGTIIVTANQAGNTNYGAAPQVTRSVVVVVGRLTVAAANATRVYGVANPTFTGTITGAVNGDTFTATFSTPATVTSPVKQYAIVPAASGTNLPDYQVILANGTLTITQAASNNTLSASATTVTPGENLTLTAQVKSTTSGTPTGSVQFYDGTTLLGTAALNAGTATYATTKLSSGVAHSLSAAYLGDTNFTVSKSPAIEVIVATLDFTLKAAGSTSQTVTAGGVATYVLQVAPTNEVYPGTVTLAAANLPAGATATFSPMSVPANGGKQTVMMRVQTAAVAAGNMSRLASQTASLMLGALLLPLAKVRRQRNSRRRLGRANLILLTAVALAGMFSLTGCGAQNGFLPPPGNNYVITVTASSGTLQHGLAVNLKVQ